MLDESGLTRFLNRHEIKTFFQLKYSLEDTNDETKTTKIKKEMALLELQANERYKQSQRIVYRLLGFFIPIDEIAIGTGLTEDEVQDLGVKRQLDATERRKKDFLYNTRYMELDEEEDI